MNTDQVDESGETVLLILLPLTPDEWERNQAIVEKLLNYVLGEQDTDRSGLMRC